MEHHHWSMRRLIVAAVAACVLAVVAAVGSVYAIVNQQIVATNLCATINATRGPDPALTGKPGFNARQEYRDLWSALGNGRRADLVPDAPVLDCSTGKPTTTKEK